MALIQKVEEGLIAEIEKAINGLEELNINNLPPVKLEVPRDESHGDYATNIAMVLAGQAKMAPRQIAEIIKSNLEDVDLIEKVEVAGPGFINFHLSNSWLYDVLLEVHNKGQDYGKVNLGENKKVQVEFVSVNPTGPLHVGHSRGAVVGDVLSNLLIKAGFDVTKEYYINDAGNQMNILGNSVAVRYRQLLGEDIEMPEDAYKGDYIKDIAQDIIDEFADKYLEEAKDKKIDFFREYGYKYCLKNIEEDLNSFGIEFDNWFSERTLHPEGIEEIVREFKDSDLIYEKDGALWFKSTEFGDDKDRVVIKDDGNPTYLAADMAYHKNKYNRGFEEVINVWGADHHGYIERMKAVVEALGYERDALLIILVQLVTLLRDGEQVPMSKRAGNFVTLRDVVREVGKDAARYFYVMLSTNSHLDFDLELAKKQSSDNPVYYIQYAYARICSILDQVDEAGIEVPSIEDVQLSKLEAEEEIDLIKALADYPNQIEKSAKNRAPHYIARYAYDLASLFHKFYNKCYVLIEDKQLMKARLILVLAAKQVLVNVLDLLGLDSPASM
ncbi:arginine--tRNA ligase [Halonatronum saccharophilum]|uniref:arginine--tRNA ligase n=1 Tax=Halonatronum saccharophilum TaxID=150060 RepID=UPI0004B21A69|nr:arginine--tRNA ligase [Halonatronum saccharophilum]